MGFMGLGDSGGDSPYLKRAASAIEAVNLPTVDAMRVRLQQLVSAGVLTPQQAQTYLQQATSYNDINLDPTTRSAQISALAGLQDEANSGGMGAIDKQKLAEITGQFNTANQGAQQAIMQNAAERGVQGSGLEMASRLLAEQNAATNASGQATQAASDASSRALAALSQSGQLGGQINAQDFQQAASKAAAQDAINQFNTQNKQAVENTNVANNNAAQAYNLQNQQNLSNQNVANANQNAYYNANLYQQNYQNQLGKASALGNVYSQQAAADQAAAQRNAGFLGNVIGAAGTVVGGIYGGPAGAAAGGAEGKALANSKQFSGAVAHGGRVPGRAPVSGDSYANDLVPATLSPGEVVVPRSVAAHPSKADEFVKNAKVAGNLDAPHPHDVASVLAALHHIRHAKKAA